jgi:Ser/Thr protein kinase RdoA (MazF antagonist)
MDGRVLVKQVEVAGREREVERAAQFEQRVSESGVDVARPIPPAGEALGLNTQVDGLGWVRAYEWVDGRELREGDDVAAWLGHTMATIHLIEPAPAPDPVIYGIQSVDQWSVWLTAGERMARPWAPLLRERLDGILEILEWVSAALGRAADYVVTHRDIEPWNVMMTADGPVLVDWDPAGPDSASLEACHAAFAFAYRGTAEPGADEREAGLMNTLAAYVDAGGRLRPDGDLLARRVGMRVSRLGSRLSVSTLAEPLGPHQLTDIDARAVEQILALPEFSSRLRVLGRAIAARL